MEEKCHETNIIYGKHRNNEGRVNDHYNLGNLSEIGISRSDTIEKYSRLVKKLWDLKVETNSQRDRGRANSVTPQSVKKT